MMLTGGIDEPAGNVTLGPDGPDAPVDASGRGRVGQFAA